MRQLLPALVLPCLLLLAACGEREPEAAGLLAGLERSAERAAAARAAFSVGDRRGIELLGPAQVRRSDRIVTGRAAGMPPRHVAGLYDALGPGSAPIAEADAELRECRDAAAGLRGAAVATPPAAPAPVRAYVASWNRSLDALAQLMRACRRSAVDFRAGLRLYRGIYGGALVFVRDGRPGPYRRALRAAYRWQHADTNFGLVRAARAVRAAERELRAAAAHPDMRALLTDR